jgi:hypothetical protein
LINLSSNISKPIIKAFNESMVAAPAAAKQGFFSIMIGDVHLWVLLFCAVSMFMLIGVMAYVFRELLLFTWLRIRKPQKLIKIFIHYAGGMETIHYRTIPKSKKFDIDGENYYYDASAMTRDRLQKKLLTPDMEHEKFEYIIDGKRYSYDSDMRVKYRWDKYPKLHYFHGNPNPIDWAKSYETGKLSSYEDSQMDEANLFVQLLKYSETKQMMIFLLIMLFICIAVSGATALKVFGVFK